VQPGGGEVGSQLGDPRLVADRRPRVRAAGGRVIGILAAGAVHLVQPLGPVVVGRQVGVGDGPGGGYPVDVLYGSEVPLPEPVEDGAVELGVPADVVVLLRGELPAVGGVGPPPAVVVALVDPQRLRIPVLWLPGKPVSPLQ
jgi:hypothetical protein